MSTPIDRRRFLTQSAGLGALAAGLTLSADDPRDRQPAPQVQPDDDAPVQGPTYPDDKPRVIVVRFGGGVRRQECVLDADRTYCPFVYHELFKRQGVLLSNVEIDQRLDVETSHGQGTLYILTGKYERYRDFENRFLGARFEASVPTIFEYFRRTYPGVAPHQALLINGEDRVDEEFYTFSNHHQFGVRYRSTVLSLYRFKTFLLRDEIENGRLVAGERRVPLNAAELQEVQQRLRQMESLDYRVRDRRVVSPELNRFWENWRAYYGRSGMVNPRGDRLLTTLAVRALHQLRPKLIMINYQDPDYVHWGNPQFYTRAISIIDEGIREIYSTTQSIPEYRDNTVFLIVPDCGRDSNRAMPVPFQHHFNTRSAHEIFVVAAGPGIAYAEGRPINHLRQQCSVAATVGRIMNFPTPHVDGGAGVLEEVLA